MTQMTDAITALTGAKDTFDAYLAALDNPAALAALGINQFAVKRINDDSNVTVAYPGGTSLADAVLTHTYSYQSEFPDKETTVHFSWASSIKLDQPDDNRMLARVALCDDNRTLISNALTLGIEDGSTGAMHNWRSVSGLGALIKPANEVAANINLSVWMGNGEVGSTASTYVDNLELQIMEVVNA